MIQVTEEMIAKMTAAKFYIEDLGTEYGPEYEGEYRWVNSETFTFQDNEESYNVNDAWLDCMTHNSFV